MTSLRHNYAHLEITARHPAPVIDAAHPDLAGNLYGFEGGAFLRAGDMFHLFTAEMWGDPFWAAMRFGHWQSANLYDWSRVGTLMESKGGGYEADERFSIWSPMPIYNEQEERWNLFYVAYRGPLAPDEGQHTAGKIVRAVSQAPGWDGLGGPYQDAGVILQPDENSQAWEGQQGTASFYPYKVKNQWYSFYCSHNYHPPGNWPAGLVAAPALEGPWQRLPETMNPSPIEPDFIENPLVYAIGGRYWAVYDSADIRRGVDYIPEPFHIGYSVSDDGIHWPPGKRLAVQSKDSGNWSEDIRTPLGMLPLNDTEYAILYTGKNRGQHFWSVGLATARIAE